jgi:hypothetical protein
MLIQQVSMSVRDPFERSQNMDDLFTSISVVYNASSNMWNVVPSLGYMPAAQYVHGAAEHAKRSAAKHTKKNNYENPEDLSEK